MPKTAQKPPFWCPKIAVFVSQIPAVDQRAVRNLPEYVRFQMSPVAIAAPHRRRRKQQALMKIASHQDFSVGMTGFEPVAP